MAGALKTAELAAEQGKDVWAVPGDITRETAFGTNRLIFDGASAVTQPGDPFSGLTEGTTYINRKENQMGAEEWLICDRLRKAGEQTVEQLVAGTGLSPSKVAQLVTLMEMKGFVETCMGRVFLNEGF